MACAFADSFQASAGDAHGDTLPVVAEIVQAASACPIAWDIVQGRPRLAADAFVAVWASDPGTVTDLLRRRAQLTLAVHLGGDERAAQVRWQKAAARVLSRFMARIPRMPNSVVPPERAPGDRADGTVATNAAYRARRFAVS